MGDGSHSGRILELGGISTHVPRMARVLESIRRFARLDTPVLIQGETGTGKELVARALHALSDRRSKPLITIDCQALPESLAESELFGHERGAFTGADRSYGGRIEAATGGTLFLDEVNSVSLAVQGKLLRFLEERELHRIGRQRPISVDVWVIAAANLPLEQCVREGRMRADFFHRLNVLTIDLPPLRERLDDLPLLVEQFLAHDGLARRCGVTEISADALARLRALSWPGNVRELHNVLRRSVVAGADGHLLRRLDLFPDVLPPSAALPNEGRRPAPEAGPEPPAVVSFRAWMRQREHEYLVALLEHHIGVARQATVSGLPQRTLFRKLKALGLRAGTGIETAAVRPAAAHAFRDAPRAVLAPNAGLTTGPGTNQYLIGEQEAVLVDLAPLTDTNARRVTEAVSSVTGRIAHVLLTHLHGDHSGGALAMRRASGVSIAVHARHAGWAHDGEPVRPDRLLADGDEIVHRAGRLRVVHTPGHESGHCAFYDPDRCWLFAGDLVLACGLPVIAPPDGDMVAYLASLRRLLALDLRLILPGHGSVIENPYARIEECIEQHLMRERRVVADLAHGPMTIRELVWRVYADVDPMLHGATALTMQAHLVKLIAEGVAIEAPGNRFRLSA